MAYMHVDIDLNEVDDEEMIYELEDRGYTVVHSDDDDDPYEEDGILSEMIWRYKNGYIEDAMLLLERRFPEMYGISKRIKT
jgi:hypothetical protein